MKTEKEVIENYIADLLNLVSDSPARNSRIIDLRERLHEIEMPPSKPAIIEWSEIKQKYPEHLINKYDHSYLALLEWLEINYSGIALPKKEFKEILHSICKPKFEINDKQREEQQNYIETCYRRGWLTDRERDFTHRAL